MTNKYKLQEAQLPLLYFVMFLLLMQLFTTIMLFQFDFVHIILRSANGVLIAFTSSKR